MKTIEVKRSFNVSPQIIWNIVSDLSRSDWVPGVESMMLEDNIRTFKMKGMGRLVEKVLKCDHDALELEYSAIETLAPINHHLAKIKLVSNENESTDFIWTTEVDPEEFADAILQAMVSSLDQLELVLSETT
ncbi:MAG: SRPBCC family protein [Gammaproteobacteria bacterium]